MLDILGWALAARNGLRHKLMCCCGGKRWAGAAWLTQQETDKATIDVEAQDDGVMGKIVFQAGSKGVPVGEVIAVLAEEGDDLSKLEVPSDLSPQAQAIPTTDAPKEAPKEEKKESAPAPSSAPKAHRKLDHSKPMFPSVERMLLETSLSDEAISKIKGTGRHGMLTKGDILAAEGKISSPFGSAAGFVDNPMGASGKRANEVSGAGVRGRHGASAAESGGPRVHTLRPLSEHLASLSKCLGLPSARTRLTAAQGVPQGRRRRAHQGPRASSDRRRAPSRYRRRPDQGHYPTSRSAQV